MFPLTEIRNDDHYNEKYKSTKKYKGGVRRGRYFANFAKSFRTGRSESTKRKISRNNEESLERVPGVFSKMAASINDAVLLKYRVFERNKCYYCCYVLLMRV